MAHALHVAWLSSIAMLCACVVPPHAEPVEGINRPPIVVEPRAGTRRTVDQSAAEPYDNTEFQIRVRDPNLDDELSLRAFVDNAYESVVPIDPDVIKSTTFADGTRVQTFRINGLCDTILPPPAGDHLLELFVSDRGFADTTGSRVPDDAGWDVVSWTIVCVPPTPVTDGGP